MKKKRKKNKQTGKENEKFRSLHMRKSHGGEGEGGGWGGWFVGRVRSREHRKIATAMPFEAFTVQEEGGHNRNANFCPAKGSMDELHFSFRSEESLSRDDSGSSSSSSSSNTSSNSSSNSSSSSSSSNSSDNNNNDSNDTSTKSSNPICKVCPTKREKPFTELLSVPLSSLYDHSSSSSSNSNIINNKNSNN
ncbi:hypothetical protein V1477_005942, partial [Vespula maculifrons]